MQVIFFASPAAFALGAASSQNPAGQEVPRIGFYALVALRRCYDF